MTQWNTHRCGGEPMMGGKRSGQCCCSYCEGYSDASEAASERIAAPRPAQPDTEGRDTMSDTPYQTRERREAWWSEYVMSTFRKHGITHRGVTSVAVWDAMKAEAKHYAPLLAAAKHEIRATHGNISGPCKCPLCEAVANLEDETP
jgi:hypothetical protein